MKGYRAFLAYYSIIVTTALAVGSVFFIPKPIGFIVTLLFLPVTVYFWLRVSLPTKGSARGWSARLMLVVFLFSLLSVFAYSLTTLIPQPNQHLIASTESDKALIEELKNKLEEERDRATEYDDLAGELSDIKDELFRLGGPPAGGDSLGGSTLGKDNFTQDPLDLASTDEMPAGKLTISDPKWSIVDVYAQDSFASQVIGEINFGVQYSFFESTGSWYKVDFGAGELGWIRSIYVKEQP